MRPALATGTIATWASAKHSTGRAGRSLHVLASPWRQVTLARSCYDRGRKHLALPGSPLPWNHKRVLRLEIKMCMIGSHVVRLMALVSIPVSHEPAFVSVRSKAGKTGTGRISS